jgi:ribosomal-protein-alanine N-acetyltransferase
MIFETERLIVRHLDFSDADLYFDMSGNPNVMEPIPVKAMTRQESDDHLNGLIALDPDGIKKVWAIDLKGTNEFIGLTAIIENDELDEEIGYRLREKHWYKGYGTEVAIGTIDFAFKVLNLDKLAADANTANPKSMKILDKFFTRVRTFENEEGNCVDQRFILYKDDWEGIKGK